MTDKLTTASVLAFERKLDPSDAVFHAGRWDDRAQSHAWQPVTVRAKSVRGTISNRLPAKDQDPAKLNAKIETPNLQTVDVAALPAVPPLSPALLPPSPTTPHLPTPPEKPIPSPCRSVSQGVVTTTCLPKTAWPPTYPA